MTRTLDVWFPLSVYILLLLMLALPILTFCVRGWGRRYSSILSDFNEKAFSYYMKCFHSSDLAQYGDKYPDNFLRYYKKYLSRVSYLIPGLLLITTTAVLLAPCAVSVSLAIKQRDIASGPFPLVVILAIAGGYMWCLYDTLYKTFNELLLPRDLYWSAFRLWICVPAGYSIGKVFEPTVSLPIAFCLGALPTWDLILLLRVIAYRLTKTGSTDQDTQSDIRSLPSVDLQAAEIMRYEGITSVQNLSTADPVKLTIRSGKPFADVIGMIGDAILWNYLGTKDRFDFFRLCGANGAYDCGLLQHHLEEPDDSKDKQDAVEKVKHLASKLGVPEAAIRNLLSNVANDPMTELIEQLWA